MNEREKQQIDFELYKMDNKGRAYTRDRDPMISLIFRCDMKTAQDIVNRIGNQMGIGTDPIVVLKTAEPDLIAYHTYQVLCENAHLVPDPNVKAPSYGEVIHVLGA